MPEVAGTSAEPSSALPPARRGGFWLIVGALGAVSIVLVVAIWANRGIKDNIGHAQASLRAGQTAAEEVWAETGSFAQAGAAALSDSASPLTFRGPQEPSTGLDDLSVSADEKVWAAAVRAGDGACFFLRLEATSESLLEVSYGVGSVCTGAEALGALDARW